MLNISQINTVNHRFCNFLASVRKGVSIKISRERGATEKRPKITKRPKNSSIKPLPEGGGCNGKKTKKIAKNTEK